MRVMIVQARYRQRSGEDIAVDAEMAALTDGGVEVVPFLGDNATWMEGSPVTAVVNALWSRPVHRRLRQALRDRRPDVVHVHNTFPALSASVYAATREAGIPLVHTLHNFRFLCTNALMLRDGQPCDRCLGAAWPWRGIGHACYRDSRLASALAAGHAAIHRHFGIRAGLVDRYIALSPSARDRLVAGGLPADRIVVKPNLIPDPGMPDAARPRHGILFVGRLAPEKGLATLLEALDGLSLPLVVAGDGPLAARLRDSAKGNVRWLGAVSSDEVSRLMREAALLAFPSLAFENFPLAIAEAMAHGLPTLASDRGSMRDMIEPGRTGWLVETGNVAAWRESLQSLMADPDRLRAAGAAARAHFVERYAPAATLARQLALYEELIAEARATATGRVQASISPAS